MQATDRCPACKRDDHEASLVGTHRLGLEAAELGARWLATGLCVATVIAANAIFAGTPIALYASLAAAAALIVVCLLTGTRPG